MIVLKQAWESLFKRIGLIQEDECKCCKKIYSHESIVFVSSNVLVNLNKFYCIDCSLQQKEMLLHLSTNSSLINFTQSQKSLSYFLCIVFGILQMRKLLGFQRPEIRYAKSRNIDISKHQIPFNFVQQLELKFSQFGNRYISYLPDVIDFETGLGPKLE